MPYSVPNQKWIQVHKPRVTERFLQISHEDWMQANKTLSPYGLQLYLYLASNNDNYEFALSPADAEVRAGIKNTSFRKYMKKLEEEGYIVWRKGNIFDFYTSPRVPEERTNHEQRCECINFEETPCDDDSSHGDMEEIATRSIFSPDDGGASHLASISSQSIREIDNRYIDMRDDGIDKIDAGRPRTPARPDGEAIGPRLSKGKEDYFSSGSRINPNDFAF